MNACLPVSLADLPALAVWRSAFRQFGVDPTKYRCAAQAFLRRLSKAGDISTINALVDIHVALQEPQSLMATYVGGASVSGQRNFMQPIFAQP